MSISSSEEMENSDENSPPKSPSTNEDLPQENEDGKLHY